MCTEAELISVTNAHAVVMHLINLISEVLNQLLTN